MIDFNFTASIIKNFHFIYPAGWDSSAVMIWGRGKGWRVTGCFFDNQAGNSQISVLADGYNTSGIQRPWGLVDNNVLGDTKLLSYGTALIDNTSWAEASGLGDGYTVYVEKNTIARSQAGALVIDGSYGGSYVLRYNNITDAEALAHGVQGANRALRRWEVYHNDFIFDIYGDYAGFMRGGTGVWFGNRLTGSWTNKVIKIDNQRSCGSVTGALQCNGASPWDENVGAGDAAGYRCRDQIGASTDTVKWVSTEGSEGEFTQTTDPAYAWDNYAGATSVDFLLVNDCAAQTAQVVSGRDFVNNGDTPKPGYVKFKCPYPVDAYGFPDPDGEVVGTCDSAIAGITGYTREDIVDPTILSVTVDPSGAFVTIRGSENLAVTTGAGYTLSSDASALTLTHSSISGTDIIQATSRTILSTETLTYSYTGTDTKDLSANELIAITDAVVTNSSTQTETPPPGGGGAIFSGGGSTVFSGGGTTVWN